MIVNQNIGIVAKYTYDAWGKLLSVTDESGTTLTSGIGIDNPIRYRSYVYDDETGLYYLGSRYYDPVVCRFVNAKELFGIDSFTTSNKNLYSFCENNSLNCHLQITYAIVDNSVLSYQQYSDFVIQPFSIKVFYEVPLYYQGKYSLCWAFCQVMVEDYNNGVFRTNTTATYRAIEIAKSVNGNDWNKGGWPTNTTNKFSELGKPTPTLEDIYIYLRKYGPIYAYYSGNGSAHLVVITGVDLTNGIIYSNNPWGISGTQSYMAFLNGFIGLPENIFKFGFFIFPDK